MDREGSYSSHSTRCASGSVGNQRWSASNRSSGTAVGATGEDFNSLIVAFYTRVYPSADVFADDAAEFDLEDISEAVTELANEVSALQEETHVLGSHVQTLQQRRPGGGATVSIPNISESAGIQLDAADNSGSGALSPVDTTVFLLGGDYELSMGTSRTSGGGAADTVGSTSGTGRRGRSFRRRSLADVDAFMRVDDKAVLLRQETARLRTQEEKAAKEAEGVHEMLVATVEEAIRRRQELRLEMLQFEREVLRNGGAEDDTAEVSAHRRNPLGDAKKLTVSSAAVATTADELLRYLERRHSTQVSYLDKLEVQCQAAEQDIARAQQLVRQRRAAGEAFQAVDMEQLRIEHKQFSERMEAKNKELAELKGTSTRTVQQLNHLMGQLNELASEQTRLKREAKSRSEYLSRCGKEIATATAEAVQAESKHMTLKAQQEAVKVPKIEEYMAQKAEEVELQKAVKNLERKVQIAEGQAAVVRQQSRRLQAQRASAIKYANEKHLSRNSTTSRATASAGATASSRPAAGSARGLLMQRRQQREQEQQPPSLPEASTVEQDGSAAAPAADQPAAAATTATVSSM
ncbi:conserved hypothetical protein [Leishmania major strain Friedlin]|uniref:Cilia- and flagella-associated protein 263 n=1 Tax=Leishmania major TaxID=5664 RepID=Q4QFQ1_LEIMA|nr:conserved hypothetical protein [Leishmania major strain Friedlin]AAY42342.1 excreted/secreted protein 9.1 [Leishmania major]CAG9571271.1 Domain_of_unknown_function_(DUF4201)_-_putative [Leishmania major strain Friedlin]CAJ03069.1 conserved hypothetical protein [Leishmania major strain Friedlin]|eukprot:XP_001687683.1 conserved hypothetical protein [Leishmania major strain Friedlin]